MEFDCTMHPMKPSARMIATEKKPARKVPNLPAECGLDVVDRTAVNDAFAIDDTCLLCEHRLGVVRGHT